MDAYEVVLADSFLVGVSIHPVVGSPFFVHYEPSDSSRTVVDSVHGAFQLSLAWDEVLLAIYSTKRLRVQPVHGRAIESSS